MAWNPATATSSVVTVATAGTPVQVVSSHKAIQSVLIQALPNNTGRIVVGSANTVRANAAGTNPSGPVLAIIGAPSANTATPPSANGGNPTAPAAINLEQFWIDASVSGEGVIVSYLA
jgi:hypothetical protein